MLNIESTYDPAIPLLAIYPRNESRYSNKYLSPNIHRHIAHNSQKVEIT